MQSGSQIYSRTAITFHWLVFAFIAINVALAFTMMKLPFGDLKKYLFLFHKWIGVLVLLLAVARILWRVGHRAPRLVPMPRWQALAARVSHYTLYVLIVAVPAFGYLFSSAMGYRIKWFNAIPLPTIIDEDMDLALRFRDAHIILAQTLIVLVIIHVLAALKHYFIDRDGTLQRMLPGLRTPATNARRIGAKAEVSDGR